MSEREIVCGDINLAIDDLRRENSARIPLRLAPTAVFGPFGLVALTSHVVPMANEAPALVLLIGLSVGVDYSIFYLKRAREERAAGRSVHAAVEVGAAPGTWT